MDLAVPCYDSLTISSMPLTPSCFNRFTTTGWNFFNHCVLNQKEPQWAWKRFFAKFERAFAFILCSHNICGFNWLVARATSF
jgi:hypothetical protein